MKIYVVVHHRDEETTISQTAIAKNHGADGVFLIAHGGEDDELVDVAKTCKVLWPDFPIGVNLLSKPPMDAANCAIMAGLDMFWADHMGVSSEGLSPLGVKLSALAKSHPKTKFFASVAFKYRPHEPAPALAATAALSAGFIPTTSGAATGSPPEVSKISAMSSATNGLLAIASGMTPENIAKYAPYVSHVLVSTGISKDEYLIDEEKLQALIAAAKGEIL